MTLENGILCHEYSQKILFSGHRGSGKTTELLFLRNKLENDRQFLVTFVTATEEMNVADLVYTDLLFTLIKKSIHMVSHKTKLNGRKRKQLEEKLRHLIAELEGGQLIEIKSRFSFNALTNWFEAFFRTDITTRKVIRLNAGRLVNEIIEIFNSIISSIEGATDKKMVIIVDDLEKVTDEDRIIDIVLNHSRIIEELNCHIIITVPASLLYSTLFSTITQPYGTIHFLSPFHVRYKDGTPVHEQIELMRNIIRRRVSDKIINCDHLQRIALRSGGLIADYIRIIKLCLIITLEHEENHVTNRDVDEALENIVEDYGRITFPKYYKILTDVHNKKEIPDKQNKLFRELVSNQILLRYDRDWFDLHPAVKEVLISNKIIHP